MNGHYSPGDVVLGNWTLVRLIGEGSFGKVYEAEREDFGTVYKAAIKIITIPQTEGEIRDARAEGMDEESVTAYFHSIVEEIVQEFVLMSKLKGSSNVVSYEDHTVIPHQNSVGWDIIIRMELLTPLLDHVQKSSFARQDVIRLGIDICKALELCQKYNIVHRDIKPENIFVSDLGSYKLGDFGIARTVEKTTGGLSKKGTYTYMAPEVYKDGRYNSNVDIYSLGIVLYRLLNENRAPFLPPYPAPITHSDRESATAKRMSGAAFPEPKNADGRLAEIVLKACAYQPKDRYSSPIQMRQELEAILYDRAEAPIIYPAGDETPIHSVEKTPVEETVLISDDEQATPAPAAPVGEGTTHLMDWDRQETPSVQPASPEKVQTAQTPPVASDGERTALLEEGRLEMSENAGKTQPDAKRKNDQDKKKKRTIIIAASAAALVVVVVGIFALSGKGGSNVAPPDTDYTHTLTPNSTDANYEGSDVDHTIPDPADTGFENPAVDMISIAQIPDPANAGFEDPDVVKYYLTNKDSVEIGVPETFLNPQEVYANTAYTWEMFACDYQLIVREKTIDRFAEESEYFEYREHWVFGEDTTYYLTVLPFKISPPSYSDTPNIQDAGLYHWMVMYMLTWDGEWHRLNGAYTVEDNTLAFRPVQEAYYDEDTSSMFYEFGDVILEYEYAFRGTSLTLSQNGQSVTLNTGYMFREQANPIFGSHCYLAQGSAQIDNIIAIDMYWDGETDDNEFYITFKDWDGEERKSYASVGRLSEDGLLTFTVSYDPELNYRKKTYQFVYFFYGTYLDNGLILSDGEQVYYYTASFFDYIT